MPEYALDTRTDRAPIIVALEPGRGEMVRYTVSTGGETIGSGADYRPAPIVDPLSADAAAGLLGHFAAYAESVRFGVGDVPEHLSRELLADRADCFALAELEGSLTEPIDR